MAVSEVFSAYAEALPLFAAVYVIFFVVFFIYDTVTLGWKKAWKKARKELTGSAGGWFCLVLLAIAIFVLVGTFFGCPATDDGPPQLVGTILDSNGEPIAGVAVSLVGSAVGDIPNISFTLYGGARADESGVYKIRLNDVPSGTYDVLVWDKNLEPLTIRPVKLSWPIVGEIEGPTFVIGSGT